MNCPACGQSCSLNALGNDSPGACQCPVCAGLWLSRAAFDATSADIELVDSLKSLDYGQAEERSSPVNYRLCPVCEEHMSRRQYQGKGIVVDFCNAHGFWFDPGELRKILSETNEAKIAKTNSVHPLAADIAAVNAPMRPLGLGDGRLDGNPGLRFKPFLRALMKSVKSF
jgi:Zn-finger nucleic acid-binding protein